MKTEIDRPVLEERIVELAEVLHGLERSRSARVPWLEQADFPPNLAGLLGKETYSSR